MPTDRRTHISSFHTTVWIYEAPFRPLHADTFGYQYKPSKNMDLTSFNNSTYLEHQDYIMDAICYWLFAREYSIWNAAVIALQFWMADLEPHILSNAIERVHTAFFCHSSAKYLRNISEEILICCFVTTLNDAFE